MNDRNDKPYSYTPLCSWIGDGQGCTEHSAAESSYCLKHYAVVYKVGSGVRRRKDERTVNKVRMVQQLFQEAIDQLEAEGFDVYGDSEREVTVELVDIEE